MSRPSHSEMLMISLHPVLMPLLLLCVTFLLLFLESLFYFASCRGPALLMSVLLSTPGLFILCTTFNVCSDSVVQLLLTTCLQWSM